MMNIKDVMLTMIQSPNPKRNGFIPTSLNLAILKVSPIKKSVKENPAFEILSKVSFKKAIGGMKVKAREKARNAKINHGKFNFFLVV